MCRETKFHFASPSQHFLPKFLIRERRFKKFHLSSHSFSQNFTSQNFLSHETKIVRRFLGPADDKNEMSFHRK